MRRAVRVLRWFVAAIGLLTAVLLAGFGLLQTQAGRTWFASTIAQTISDPDFTVAIKNLSGVVPFRLKVDRIEIGDRDVEPKIAQRQIDAVSIADLDPVDL